MTAPESSADLLRRAADRLDQLAAATTGDRWEVVENYPDMWVVSPLWNRPPPKRTGYVASESDSGDLAEPDVHWIAAMGPQVAAPIAAWLRGAAPQVEWRYDTAGYREAIEFARLLLGEDS